MRRPPTGACKETDVKKPTLADLRARIEADEKEHDAEVERLETEVQASRLAEDKANRARDAALVRADELRADVHRLELSAERMSARLQLLAEQDRKADGDEMITLPRRMIEPMRMPEGGMIDSTFGRDRPKPWWK